MANKRMFSLSVVDTDRFLEMPISSRLLYYELGMRADDDGFVDNWKKILLFTGLKEDDMKVLIAKKFIIPFDSGVIVIRHWRMNNYLRNDRYKGTNHKEELEKLGVDSNGVYQMDTTGIPGGIHSIDKNSIDKNSIVKNNIISAKSTTIDDDNLKIINNWDENKMCECRTKQGHMCNRRSSYNINGKNYCNQHSRQIIGDVEAKRIYFKNEEVNNIFMEFLQLRKKLKAVNSDRAIKLLINQLEKYDDDIKIKMIEQSILNSWKSVYELKATKKEKETFNDRLDRWAESRKED